MSEIFSKLDPQVGMFIALAWVLREIFGWVQKFSMPLVQNLIDRKNQENSANVICQNMVHTLNENVQASRELVIAVKIMCQKLDEKFTRPQ